LANKKVWSNEFNDFLACCLKKDPAQRYTTQQLLQHPFLIDAEKTKGKFITQL
jgi:serine/threonine protein kinase